MLESLVFTLPEYIRKQSHTLYFTDMNNAKLARQAFQRGAIAQALRRRAETVLDTLEVELIEPIADQTPVDTGELKSGWRTQREGLTLTIYNDTDHANEVEYSRSGGMLRRNTMPDVLRERARQIWKGKA
jgi:hypothetical protein